MLKPALLMLLSGLLLGLSPGVIDARGLRQSEQHGYFGTVSTVSTDHPRAVSGETDITLDTDLGPVEMTATEATVVRVHGQQTASVGSISVGDSVAVISSDGIAISILVRTPIPVRTRHFTGVVTSVEDDGTVSFHSEQGDHLSALALTDVPGLSPGELVTAVVEQDLGTGSLLVTGLDRAIDSLDRIQSALDLARSSNASATLEALRRRLTENGARHLSTLQAASQVSAPSLRGRVRQELESAVAGYAAAFSRAGGGKPEAEVTGIVTSIDEERRLVTVDPRGLEPVELGITSETSIQLQGRQIRLDQLDLASRVTVRYDVEAGSASRVLVSLGQALDRRTAAGLLSMAKGGEVSGTVTGVDPEAVPPRVTVRDSASGDLVELTASINSVILAGGLPAALSSLPGTAVAASFDPESSSIIELDTETVDASEATVTGVVHSVIRKPAIPSGNLSIYTEGGQIGAFLWDGETVIRRDGLQVTINEVRLGDLVRPNTSYRVDAGETTPSAGSVGELVLLSLKSPRAAPVRGTIRGITASPDGDIQVTLSNIWLELTSLVVTEDTELIWQGTPAGTNVLAVGQRVVRSTYDPLSSTAIRLVLDPARALQVKGEITAVDDADSAITITPRRGDPVRLLVLDSTPTRINLQGNPDPRFNDLRVGHQVRAGFYDPASMEALRLVVN